MPTSPKSNYQCPAGAARTLPLTIGLIGGMGWEASAVYYQRLNEIIHAELKNMACADILMHSLNNRAPAKMMYHDNWDELSDLLLSSAKKLENAGAKCIALACNSVHHMADQIDEQIKIPFLHIADAVGEETKKRQHKKLCLLGTKFTCKMDFYKKRLEQFDLEVTTPNEDDLNRIHQIIYHKLKKGSFSSHAESEFTKICERLQKENDGLILACTELPLLLKSDSQEIYDTIELHCQMIANFSLGTPSTSLAKL